MITLHRNDISRRRRGQGNYNDTDRSIRNCQTQDCYKDYYSQFIEKVIENQKNFIIMNLMIFSRKKETAVIPSQIIPTEEGSIWIWL